MLPALAVLLALASGPAAAQPPADPGALAQDVAWLERRLELASTDEFYLELDPQAARLALMLGTVSLVAFTVDGFEVAAPTTVFTRAPAPAGWREVIWRQGTLSPPWPVQATTTDGPVDPLIGAAADAAAAERPAPLPPTIEELVPVPDRYWVRFEGGLALEVRPETGGESGWDGTRQALRWWLQDVRHLLAGGRDAVRLRLSLPRADAERLYRSLPPLAALVIAPERPPVP